MIGLKSDPTDRTGRLSRWMRLDWRKMAPYASRFSTLCAARAFVGTTFPRVLCIFVGLHNIYHVVCEWKECGHFWLEVIEIQVYLLLCYCPHWLVIFRGFWDPLGRARRTRRWKSLSLNHHTEKSCPGLLREPEVKFDWLNSLLCSISLALIAA